MKQVMHLELATAIKQIITKVLVVLEGLQIIFCNIQ